MGQTDRADLIARLGRIESALRLSAIVGDDSDDGIAARIVRAVDAWAAERARAAEAWRVAHVPGYVPAPPPPVPSEVLKKTAPEITAALKAGANLSTLSKAAAKDLANASVRWSMSIMGEMLPYAVAIYLANDALKGRA